MRTPSAAASFTLKTIFVMVASALVHLAFLSTSCLSISFTSVPVRRTALRPDAGALKVAAMLIVFISPRTMP